MSAKIAIFTGFAVGLAISASVALAQTSSTANATSETVATAELKNAPVSMVSVDMLAGKRVFDANEEWVGLVSTVLPQEDTEHQRVIIDIGAALGIGQKLVALPDNEVIVKLNDKGEVEKVSVDMTLTEMNALPEVQL